MWARRNDLVKRLVKVERERIPAPEEEEPGALDLDFDLLNPTELSYLSFFFHDRHMNIGQMTGDEADCLRQIVMKGKGLVTKISPRFEIHSYLDEHMSEGE